MMQQALQPPHITFGNKWVLVKDPSGVMKDERARHDDTNGEYAIGFIYVDHTAGISMRIWWFCKKNFLGRIVKTVDLHEKRIGYILRHDLLPQFEMGILTEEQIKYHGLPQIPEFLETYAHPGAEPLRTLDLLHPLRAPGYPDDIKFAMVGEGMQVEEVWGRLERRLGDILYECTLLNQPHQDFGVNAGDQVVVLVRLVMGNHIESRFMGPLSALQQMIEDSPPNEGG